MEGKICTFLELKEHDVFVAADDEDKDSCNLLFIKRDDDYRDNAVCMYMSENGFINQEQDYCFPPHFRVKLVHRFTKEQIEKAIKQTPRKKKR